MKSLFFVSSPLEMICAIEARNQFKTTNNILVLYLFEVDRNIVNNIISSANNWDTIHTLDRSSKNYGKKWVKLTNKLKKENYQYLFTSGMPFSAHLLHNIKFKDSYFLDDGTLTLNNVSFFKEHGNLTKKMSLFPGHNKFKFKHKLNEALHYLFGHKLSGKWEQLNLFTFFNIEKSKNIHIVKNKLEWFGTIKEKKKIVTNEELVYIIGTPLIFANITSRAYYYELIKKITLHFKNKKIVYIPHRWEPKEEIERIKDTFKFEIKPNKNIIEIDFLVGGIVPKHIAGTISTALFTLKNLYPDTIIYSTSIDINEVPLQKKDSVQAILDYQKGLFQKI